MGTMLITAIALGTAAAFIELRVGLGTFMREFIAKSALLGIVFSVMLSLFLGALFGAAGVTVMLIAIVCMTLTQPVYMIYNKLRKTGHDIQDVTSNIKKAVSPFVSLFKLAFKILFLPLIILYKIASWASSKQSVKTTA